LAWVGLEPLFCDVDPKTHQIDVEKVAALLKESGNNIAAILAINHWGSKCDAAALQRQADQFRTRLYFDSVHAYGNVAKRTSVGNFGDVEVFSLHAGQIMGGAEGGFLCTNDDLLAARLRNIRSSYGAGTPVAVVKTSNGRMSEAQAALGLLHLDDFPQLQSRNRELFGKYESGLGKIPGVRMLKPSGVDSSNHAYLICEIEENAFGMNRDKLLKVLRAENINAQHHACFETALTCPERTQQFPHATEASRACLQLPLGADVSTEAVERVCARIAAARSDAAGILSGT